MSHGLAMRLGVCRFIHDLCPQYVVPSRKTVRKILRAMHARSKLQMLERMQVFNPNPPLPQYAMSTAACLMCDGWSSRANRHYMAILLRTLDTKFNLVRRILVPSSLRVLQNSVSSIADDLGNA